MVLQVATGLAAGCLPQGSCAARIMLLVGGPATAGPGKVVDMELSEPIRWIFLFDDFLATVVCCAGGHCSQAACGSVVPNRSTCQLSAIVFLSAALEVMHLLFCQSCVCSQFLLLHKIAPVLPRRSHKDLAKESSTTAWLPSWCSRGTLWMFLPAPWTRWGPHGQQCAALQHGSANERTGRLSALCPEQLASFMCCARDDCIPPDQMWPP